MKWYQRLEQWHQTKLGLAVFGLVELGLAYVSASQALDSGSLLRWFIAIVLFIGAMVNFVKLLGKVFKHGR
ncbi:MAG TPA: hypothetical protein VK983_05305 [Candidatus Limnocylindrales bacterium]|nr:hypothetical protein [Candidatus Limnocylindrales bacterium]